MKNNIIQTPIIPIDQIFYNTRTQKVQQWETVKNLEIDYKALALFCSLGFMLDDETFYKEIKTCKPMTKYKLNNENMIIDNNKYWQWNFQKFLKNILAF